MAEACRLGGRIGSGTGMGAEGPGPGERRHTYLDLDMVERCSQDALKANPCNVEALYTLGKCLVERRSIEEAEAIVCRLQALAEGLYEACVLSGHIGLKTAQLGRSQESFAKACCRATYTDKFLVYGISLFYEATGDYANARPWLVLLNKLGVEEYKSYEILFRTGICLKKMNRIQDSASTFRVIVYSPPRNAYNPAAQIQMAHLYEMQSRHDLAIEILKTVEGSGKHHLAVSRLHSWIDFKTGNFPAVCRRHRDNEATSNDPYLTYLVGRIRYMENDHCGALEMYSKAAQADSMGGMVYNSIGCVHFQQGRLVSAETAFQDALEANPRLLEASINLRLVERAMRNGPRGISGLGLPCVLRDSLPSIGNTRYLDSGEFFEDPIYSKYSSRPTALLPAEASRFELLPRRP